MTAQAAQTMQCMEVWGGNQPADSGVVMAGLDAWVYSKPHGGAKAGGDVHYVSSCATGRVTRLLVADVSGHGSEVSETASKLRALMRRYVNYIDQTRFVRALNDEFIALARQERFATAVVTTFFGPTQMLSICNAGHPSPLFHEAASGTWRVLEQAGDQTRKDASNIPLGIVDLTQYEQFSIRMRKGDMVLCYTDSLIEAKDAGGAWIGTDGLLKLVRSIGLAEPDHFIRRLLDRIGDQSRGTLGDDDITALLFRANGIFPPVPFFKRVLAPLRVLASTIASLRPGAGPAPLPEISLANIGGAFISSLNRGFDSGEADEI